MIGWLIFAAIIADSCAGSGSVSSSGFTVLSRPTSPRPPPPKGQGGSAMVDACSRCGAKGDE